MPAACAVSRLGAPPFEDAAPVRSSTRNSRSARRSFVSVSAMPADNQPTTSSPDTLATSATAIVRAPPSDRAPRLGPDGTGPAVVVSAVSVPDAERADDTCATNRYPRRATVSTYLGADG